MEPLTTFAAAVAFIGIFHLLSTVINILGKGRNVRLASAEKKRSDWYCFFKISDLLGQEEWSPSEKGERQSSGKRNEDIYEQKRQQEARRPKLYA